MGELEPREVDDDELLELDLDRDLEGDLLELLPDGDGVRDPDLDFVLLVVFEDFWASLDVRLSEDSTEAEPGT